ncbi:MAG: hypothetical protein N3F07_03925 [Candidatus Micrarchaeota archaeon]|nr:hypothetical protein [Candidatus Micrarchaeota archaeon]
MAYPLSPLEIVDSLLLIKAVLALLGTLLFIYYKMHYEQAKKHMQVHLFYAKWKVARHMTAMGAAVAGFSAGFLIELFGVLYGQQLGLSDRAARFYSSLFEIASLFAMLYVFFELSLEDVPHFQHLSESARHKHAHRHQPEQAERGARRKRGRRK